MLPCPRNNIPPVSGSLSWWSRFLPKLVAHLATSDSCSRARDRDLTLASNKWPCGNFSFHTNCFCSGFSQVSSQRVHSNSNAGGLFEQVNLSYKTVVVE